MLAIVRCRIGRLLDELLLRLLFEKYDDVVWKGEFPLSPKFIYKTANFEETYDISCTKFTSCWLRRSQCSTARLICSISSARSSGSSRRNECWSEKILWNFRKKIQNLRMKFSKNSNTKMKLSEKIQKWNFRKIQFQKWNFRKIQNSKMQFSRILMTYGIITILAHKKWNFGS